MALEGSLPHHSSSGTGVVRFGSTSSGGIRLVGGSWQGFYSGSSKMRYLIVKCCGQSLCEREGKTINPFFLNTDFAAQPGNSIFRSVVCHDVFLPPCLIWLTQKTGSSHSCGLLMWRSVVFAISWPTWKESNDKFVRGKG